jgi:putative beta-lysine N-acetyltransferase
VTETAQTYDTIEHPGDSLIHHGPMSSRVYLMKLARPDCPALIDDVETLARERGYGKIFAKAADFSREAFLERGFVQEAHVPRFYAGREDAFFWAKFLEPARAHDPRETVIADVLAAARAKQIPAGDIGAPPPLDPRFTLRAARPLDAEAMVEVYKIVFETYPFPIHDPDYLRKTMAENIAYFVVLDGDRVVAVASSEMDVKGSNVEMTDFATLPDYRGSGIAVAFLHEMEKAMRQRGIQTAFTIARALSFGMNIAFAKRGYAFAGTLINNTNICGSLESMNVWHKPMG